MPLDEDLIAASEDLVITSDYTIGESVKRLEVRELQLGLGARLIIKSPELLVKAQSISAASISTFQYWLAGTVISSSPPPRPAPPPKAANGPAGRRNHPKGFPGTDGTPGTSGAAGSWGQPAGSLILVVGRISGLVQIQYSGQQGQPGRAGGDGGEGGDGGPGWTFWGIRSEGGRGGAGGRGGDGGIGGQGGPGGKVKIFHVEPISENIDPVINGGLGGVKGLGGSGGKGGKGGHRAGRDGPQGLSGSEGSNGHNGDRGEYKMESITPEEFKSR